MGEALETGRPGNAATLSGTRDSPMGSEGIPYELETFTRLGVVADDPAAQDNGQVLLPKTQEKPVVHRREFPVNSAVVTFP